MKKYVLRIALVLLSCLMLLSAVSCSDGVDTDQAKTDVRAFLSAAGKEDYETAATYLHPDRPADLATYFARVEAEEKVDFSAGIEILKETGFSYSYYDSEVDGSAYELDLDVRIGGVTAEIEVEVVKNDNGYGIYNLEIDVED